MFAKTIVLSDAFLDMPLSSRCLYFTLGMMADDDGFVNNPKSIMRQCGATQDDLNLLLVKKFVLSFDSGVIVIKHWRINNYLRNDRHTETKYKEEKELLSVDENGAYRMPSSTLGIPDGRQTVYPDGYPQDRLGKDSIGKDSISSIPTLEEVRKFASDEKMTHIDPDNFFAHYDSVGWTDRTGEPINDWKRLMKACERSEKDRLPVDAEEESRRLREKWGVHYDNE